MTDPVNELPSRSPARGGWMAVGSAVCAAAYLWRALRSKEVFAHLTGWRDFGPNTLRDELVAELLLVAAVVLGVAALRRAGRGGRLLALAALASLAGFVADAIGGVVFEVMESDDVRRGVFLVVTELVALGAWVSWFRASRAARAAAGGVAAPVADAAAGAEAAPRRGGRLGRVALLAASFGLALAGVEAGLRVFGPRPLAKPKLLLPGGEVVPLSEIALLRSADPQDGEERTEPRGRFLPYLYMKGWYDRPRWDYFDEQGCVDYVFNRYGLRDDDFPLAKADDEYRVVAIGDSFTFGVGVQHEDCWTEVLERGLETDLERPVQVVNAGFASGHRPTTYEEWILRDGLMFDPDAVVIGFCLNDMHPSVKLYAYRDPRGRRWWRGRSELLNTVQRAVERWGATELVPRKFVSWLREDTSYWDGCQAALRRCKAALDERGVRFVVAIMPMMSALEGDSPYRKLNRMVRDFCLAEGIECVDMMARVRGKTERELWVHPTDQHPNAVGQRIIGGGIRRHFTGPPEQEPEADADPADG